MVEVRVFDEYRTLALSDESQVELANCVRMAIGRVRKDFRAFDFVAGDVTIRRRRIRHLDRRLAFEGFAAVEDPARAELQVDRRDHRALETGQTFVPLP